MDHKAIQEKRMMGYFIEATKDILRGEGIKAISVRNIANRAGYSYATLYNYFQDVKDLIFKCVLDFQEECRMFVLSQVNEKSPGFDRLKAISVSYMQFYIQYPGIFEIFFMEKTSDLAGRDSNMETINSFYTNLCEKDWNSLISENKISIQQADQLKEALHFQVHGLLLMYLNRRLSVDYKSFMNMVNRQIDFLLSAKEAIKDDD